VPPRRATATLVRVSCCEPCPRSPAAPCLPWLSSRRRARRRDPHERPRHRASSRRFSATHRECRLRACRSGSGSRQRGVRTRAQPARVGSGVAPGAMARICCATRPRAGWWSPRGASMHARRPRVPFSRTSSAAASEVRLEAEPLPERDRLAARDDDLDREGAPPGLHTARHRQDQIAGTRGHVKALLAQPPPVSQQP
jgi:hypothetical protein